MESLPLLLPPPGSLQTGSGEGERERRRDMGEEGQDGWIGEAKLLREKKGKVRIYHAQNVVVSAVQDGGQDERGKESLCVFKV